MGIVKYKNATEFVIADIPGLIEGASKGQGLGHDFLRHIERTRLLIHLIDVSSSEGRDPIEDFDIINNELFSYSAALKERPQIIVLNKADLLSDSNKALEIKEHFVSLGYDTFITSAATSKGLNELLDKTVEKLNELPKTVLFFTPEEKALHTLKEEIPYEIKNVNGVYFVSGPMITRLVASVNMDDYESMAYFQKVLKNKGVFAALEKKGIKDKDTVNMEGFEFEYYK